jgi:hypothetical protein
MDRARDDWIANWAASNPDRDPLEGLLVWGTLTPETKATLMSISESRQRASLGIQTKLLEALDSFPDAPNLKEPFRRAIMNLPHP